jgi:hypothetical protein
MTESLVYINLMKETAFDVILLCTVCTSTYVHMGKFYNSPVLKHRQYSHIHKMCNTNFFLSQRVGKNMYFHHKDHSEITLLVLCSRLR